MKFYILGGDESLSKGTLIVIAISSTIIFFTITGLISAIYVRFVQALNKERT